MASILSTKKLATNQKQLLLNSGIGLVEYDAIKIDILKFQLQDHFSKDVIFTSKNAVKAVLENAPDFKKLHTGKVFCVGAKTKEFLEELKINLTAHADYGLELGKIIATSYSDQKFIYICGNRRRDEFPEFLSSEKINFSEIEAYKTSLNKQHFGQEFDGILFFSPSGVQSYTATNNINNSTAFCIGHTTAKEVEKHTSSFEIANKPSVENVIVQAVNYFKKNRHSNKV
ncbi:uroporphyrinogen-III synthase [Gillisia sp. M10.2A]|uniref:Uroporphyrinogen-III synthase n=1 Tax=Gillisia lutea TaxID=2909668 RepID=A0ABS9ECB9_9FLAO|nr:uroporphyrinogen-III synthase [Gillisia lutea]MCF4100527.1 uroporphyrinogen-III synthase [Gillisia lutea]